MATEKRLIPESERTNLIRCLKTLHDIDFTPGVYEHSVIGRAALFLEESVNAVEVVRCKDCKNRCDEGSCPMYYVEEIEWDDDGYTEVDFVPHDLTHDEGFCDRGERRNNEPEKPV